MRKQYFSFYNNLWTLYFELTRARDQCETNFFVLVSYFLKPVFSKSNFYYALLLLCKTKIIILATKYWQLKYGYNMLLSSCTKNCYFILVKIFMNHEKRLSLRKINFLMFIVLKVKWHCMRKDIFGERKHFSE